MYNNFCLTINSIFTKFGYMPASMYLSSFMFSMFTHLYASTYRINFTVYCIRQFLDITVWMIGMKRSNNLHSYINSTNVTSNICLIINAILDCKIHSRLQCPLLRDLFVTGCDHKTGYRGKGLNRGLLSPWASTLPLSYPVTLYCMTNI